MSKTENLKKTMEIKELAAEQMRRGGYIAASSEFSEKQILEDRAVN